VCYEDLNKIELNIIIQTTSTSKPTDMRAVFSISRKGRSARLMFLYLYCKIVAVFAEVQKFVPWLSHVACKV
jgi:hypothetical protein